MRGGECKSTVFCFSHNRNQVSPSMIGEFSVSDGCFDSNEFLILTITEVVSEAGIEDGNVDDDDEVVGGICHHRR